MLQELRVVLFGGFNNILKNKSVRVIAKEFDALWTDINNANQMSMLSWSTLPLPPSVVSFKPEDANSPINKINSIDSLNEVIKTWNGDRSLSYVGLHRVGVRTRNKKEPGPIARYHREEEKFFDRRQLHISVEMRKKKFLNVCDILCAKY